MGRKELSWKKTEKREREREELLSLAVKIEEKIFVVDCEHVKRSQIFVCVAGTSSHHPRPCARFAAAARISSFI